MLPELSPGDQDSTIPVANTAQPPPSPQPRYQVLDTLRGLSLLGALFISIWAFGGFSTTQQNELLVQSKGGNYRLWGAVELMFAGKMRALICIVFGAGMVIFLSRKSSPGDVAAPDLFMRRQMWLMGFGLINALLLLWPVDLLFHLGVIGILLFPFVRMNARGLWITAIVVTLVYAGKSYWNYSEDRSAYAKYTAVIAYEKKLSKDSLEASKKKVPLKEQKKDSLSAKQKEDKAAWEGILKQHTHDPKNKDEGVKQMRNASFAKIWNHLVQAVQAREARWTYQTGVWDMAGMMLLGMALFKNRFFEPGQPRSRYLMIAIGCIAIGLLCGWYRLQFQQYALRDFTKYVIANWSPDNLLFPLERAFMATGYAAGVLLLMRAGLLTFLWSAFASVGRMALSNYLLQSIICTILFTGVGMGYFGRLQQYQLYLVVAEICIVQIVFSILWLRYFTYGPAEWMLRSLVNWKRLPNKLHESEAPAHALPLHF